MNLAFRKGTLAGDPNLDLQHETELKPQGRMNRGRREPGQSLETESSLSGGGEKKEHSSSEQKVERHRDSCWKCRSQFHEMISG